MVKNNDIVLQEGMTFTVEPGIYVQDSFGIRIEDVVIVTKDGVKVFGDLVDSLEVQWVDWLESQMYHDSPFGMVFIIF